MNIPKKQKLLFQSFEFWKQNKENINILDQTCGFCNVRYIKIIFFKNMVMIFFLLEELENMPTTSWNTTYWHIETFKKENQVWKGTPLVQIF
jgi:hypothetical protein